MKVITAYPVSYMAVKSNKCGEFSSLDASSSKGLIQSFQNWLDIKHPNWYKGGKLNKRSGYGSFGPSTKTAYSKYGSEFESGAANIPTFLNNPMTQNTGVLPANASIKDPSGKTKAGHFWDKAAGAFVKAKDLGLIDSLKNRIGQPGYSSNVDTSQVDYSEKPKMSTGVKIGIAAGVLILGTIIYLAVKNKKKK